MSEDPFEQTVLTPERLGYASFALVVPVFAYLGYTLFDDLLFGGVLGIGIGAGTFLYLPYFVRRSVIEEGDASAAAMADTYVGKAAVGMALSAGGILAFAARFVFEGAFLLPLLVGAIAAVVVYAPLSYSLPSLERIEESQG